MSAMTTGHGLTSAKRFACAALVASCGAGAAGATTGEDGGSGLVNVEHAWSMPISGFVLSTYAGTLSSDASPRTTRVFTFTPSLTKGLGGGFEAAGALPFEGLSESLSDDDFDRRFDVRRRDIAGKLRWTGSLGSPRVRGGVQGGIGLPLDDLKDIRAGGTEEPDNAFDPSVTGLLSANLGWFSFPLRVHLNGGYWWSRDDGAVYYRTLPIAVPLSGAEVAHNDVAIFGAGVEVGFRRFALFGELYTEQLMGARAQIKSAENLWRFTPGIRTEIAQSISLTGSVSFDVSKNDDATPYDPSAIHPDTHVRVGLTLGDVLSRSKYEGKRRGARTAWPLVTATELDSIAAAETLALVSAPAAEVPAPAAPALSGGPRSVPAVVATASTPQAPEPPARDRGFVEDLARRVERLETEIRLRDLETRLASLERTTPRGAPPAGAPAPGLPPAAVGVSDVPAVEPPTERPPSFQNPAIEKQEPAPQAVTVAEPETGPETTPVLEPAPAPQAVTEPAQVPERQVATVVAPAPTPPPVTLVMGAPTATRPSVTVVGTPAAATQVLPAPIVAAAPIDASGLDDPLPGETDVWAELDALAAEIEAGRMAPARGRVDKASTPVATPEPPAAENEAAAGELQVALAPAAALTGFPLAVGEQETIEGLMLGVNPISNDAVRVALDAWAELLLEHREVVVGVLVYGKGDDREGTLERTDEQAAMLRDYLVVAGVDAARVVGMGMGVEQGEGGERIVVERLR